MICSTLFVLLVAQTPNTTPTPERAVPARAPGASPFEPDDALRKALGVDASGRRSDEFTPSGDAPALPVMRLAAFVKLAGHPKPAAVVEIENVGSYTIHEGEKLSFSLPGRGPQRASREAERREPDTTQARPAGVVVRDSVPVVLRIDKIAPDGVVVEVGTLGEFLVIR